jgi:hypothetical protein
MSHYTQVLLEAASAIGLAFVGAVAVARPLTIRQVGLKSGTRLNLWSEYMSTPQYLRHTRLIGVVSLAMAALLLTDLVVRWLIS